MLTDAQIERYGRQILLPEVGGRGQERLLAACVAVIGRGTAADVTATLLRRAGIERLQQVEDATAALHVFVDAPRVSPCTAAVVAVTATGLVAALTGRPCPACFVAPAPSAPITTNATALHWQIGSLAAAEAVRLLVQANPAPRLYQVSSASSGLRSDPVSATTGCSVCGSIG